MRTHNHEARRTKGERRKSAVACLSIHPSFFILHPSSRRAFTLTELLIVMMIIGIMAAMALSALSGATELAREQRTRAIISKLDQLIMERYEGYRTRAVPIRIPATSTTAQGTRYAAMIRLYALRDLMRMELPERITDVVDG